MMGIFIAFFLERYCNLSIGLVVGTVSMTMLNSGLVALGLDTTTRNISSGMFLLILLVISSNQAVVDDLRERRKLAKTLKEQFSIT
jgi:hypothetical protein